MSPSAPLPRRRTGRVLALLAGVFLLLSVGANVALFQQAAINASEAQTLGERLAEAQRERAALEARINELHAENQRLQAVATAQAGAPLAPSPAPVPSVDRSILEQIETQVARIRGLAKLRDVPLRFLDRPGLQQYLKASIDRDYLPEERESDQKLAVVLGLLQPDANLLRIQEELLGEQVLGLYDEDSGVMYVVDATGQLGPEQKMTFAHEFTHALQDQHFNLNRLRPKHQHDNDRYLAATALAEGDAMLLERLWAQDNLSRQELDRVNRGGDSSKLEQVPLIVRTELLFPYVDGFSFVRQAYQRSGGYTGVDALFRRPPISTEQVLHPDKYVADEPPLVVDLPDLAAAMGPGWRRIDTNVLGELDLRILLEQYGDRVTATRAAAGWGGDRWELLEKDGQLAIVVRTIWDTDTDAREFFDAIGQGLRRRFPGARQDEASPTRVALTATTNAAEVRRAGADVLLVISFDRPSAEALVNAAGWP